MPKNDPKHIKVGRIGEKLVQQFLMKQGFEILETNYLKKWGEIDIIARKNGWVHFVEVKSVSCETNIRPEEHVTHEKLKRLSRVIQTYLRDKNVSDETRYRVDVITVNLNLKDKTAKIGKIENVL